MNGEEEKGQGKLEQVVDVEQTYGYGDEEKEDEKKGGDDWLKLLLAHLKDKKKMYMRPITP